MLEVIALTVGIVLCLLGFFVILSPTNILVSRFEGFHKAIRRKKKISVDKEGLSKFYAIMFFVLSIPLLIGAIIGFINPDIFKLFSTWLLVAVAVLGLLGILYCNISNRFIKPLENITEPSLVED